MKSKIEAVACFFSPRVDIWSQNCRILTRTCDSILGLLAVAVPNCDTLILYSGIIPNLSRYSVVSIQNSKSERWNVVHVCGMRLRFRSTADWVRGGVLIVWTGRISTDTCSRTVGFRSLCCTQGGNARWRTNLDRIDPVLASGLHQLWHEVGVERASLWVFECSVSRVATSTSSTVVLQQFSLIVSCS